MWSADDHILIADFVVCSIYQNNTFNNSSYYVYYTQMGEYVSTQTLIRTL